MNCKRALLTALGVVVLSSPFSSYLAAQEPAGAVALEEIVVTARKRTETLIEVPVAVSVLSSADIEQRGVQSLQDVAMFTPGLTYFDAIQSQLGTPVIRGLSQTNLNSPDRNVAVFYGGVYLSNLNATNLEILDVDRIEIVKGPQSALYGRNAFNGAINYVPAAPTQNFRSTVTGTVGTDERYEAKLMVSGPISDTLRGRLALSYNTFDGSWKNAADRNNNLGGYETKNVSGVIDWQPTEALNFRLFGYHTDDTRDSSSAYFAPGYNCGPPGLPLSAICGEVPARSTLAANPDSLAFARKVTLASLDAGYDFGPVSLKAQVARYQADTENFSDYTLGANDGAGDVYSIVNLAAPTTILRTQAVPYFIGSGKGTTSTTSEELRLESRQDVQLRWALGVFNFKNDYNSLSRVVFDGRNLAVGEVPRDLFGFGLLPGGVAYTDPANNMFVAGNLEREDKQFAYFGSLEYDITDSVTVGGELRRDKEDRSQYSVPAGAASLQEGTFKYTSWRFHADYAFTPSQRFYASAAKGVISGYFNPTFDAVARLPVPADLQTYQPATNKTYELGWKAEWLDRRLSSEFSIFLIDYKGIQISATPPAPLIANLIQNLGGAEAKGFELALNYSVNEAWRLGMTYSYSPTEFDSGTPDPGVARYCGNAAGLAAGFCPSLTFRGALLPDVSGQSLPRAPEKLASAYASFAKALNGEWSMYARGDVSYTSSTAPLSIPFAEIPSRTLTNARIGLRRGPLDLALWGRNIFDKEYVTTTINQPPDTAPLRFLFNVSQGEKATFGLTATYAFGDQ
ncbi:MAG: TonB-dependent receptor [Pseudomonadales bacterium]|nr:TonB-dependent receptor [Pseudomonadales bacterium]